MDALAAAIRSNVGTTELQVEARLNPNPTPPSIDVFPADPFTEVTAFSRVSRDVFLTVRVRVNGDQTAEQDMLLAMMGPSDDGDWLEDVFADDPTLNGKCQEASVAEGPSGFRQYDLGQGGYLGCEWRVRVIV